ncbi:multidrug resistance protein EbrB [Parageobacillus thermoglucosidasius]|uniref:DMT family transporter n=1 Tax=Parageobacillus thermoglucosidasius TaxID=1426 RepID=UPI000F62862E|nr:multidrug efflux SMR transporter [Parageobacillus thermoglucosidasius]GCD83990.1 multidrug resistance protein EbrB [Parageobacillus thermoglucosidasius]
MKGYIALGISIISEVFGTTMLKLSEGFTNIFPSIGVIVGYGLSFYFLSLCLKTVPLSLAYALWSGIGTALTTLIGVLLWRDPFNIITLVGLILIIAGVALLNASKSLENAKKPAS